MESESTSPSSRKILVIASSVAVIILVLAGGMFILTNIKNAKQEEVQTVDVKKVYTKEEKLQVLTDLAKSAPNESTSQEDRLKTLQTLTNKTASTTASSTEDKLLILQSLAASSKQ